MMLQFRLLFSLALTTITLIFACSDNKKSGDNPKPASTSTGVASAIPQSPGSASGNPANCSIAALQGGIPGGSTPGTTGADSGANPSSPAPSAGGQSNCPSPSNNNTSASSGSPSPSPGSSPSAGPSPSPSPSPGGGGDTGSWTPGLGIIGCEGQGKVWIAVDNNSPGKSGGCGESLTDFCCTKTDIFSKFPRYQANLGTSFDGIAKDGLILYGCSTDGAAKTTFHFAISNSSGIQYRNIWIGEKSNVGTPPSTCAKVQLEDLGIKTSSGSTNTNTNTSISSGTATGTATSVATSTSTGTAI